MRYNIRTTILVVLLMMAAALIQQALACTRVMYKGPNGTILTARSMDWAEDVKTNLWIFPRGMNRDGAVGKNTVRWKSKYGSVVASGYDISSTDGMNEKGLVANLLWLAESQYPEWDFKKPGLSIAAWVQYVLDNFATVEEVVKALEKEDFIIVTAAVPGQSRLATLHLSVSDPSGDSAIFEYINGKLVIHHDPSYQVMTNSPIFEKQLALNEYWSDLGGTVMLPGTNRAADRFVRASFYVNAIPQTDDPRIALAGILGVIRNCSVPYGISTPGQPNISSTQWRTISDHKNLVYYFESAIVPQLLWIDFKNIDFSPAAKVKKLNLVSKELFAGEVSHKFVVEKPFEFEGISEENLQNMICQKKEELSFFQKNWKLVSINGIKITDDFDRFFMSFDKTSGKMQSQAGCNRVSASFEITEKGMITFSQGITTRMICKDMKPEEEFLEALNTITNYEVTNDKMILKAFDKEKIILERVE